MPDRTLPPEDLRAWQLAHEQQPGGYPAPHSIGPHTPSPIKEAEYGTTDFLRGIGSFGAQHNIPFLRGFDNPQRAKDVAERLTFASEFVPGYGDILGGAEGGYIAEENPLLGAGITGVSMIPIIGDIAGRAARKKAADLAERRLAEAGLSRTLTPSPTRVERTVTGPSTAETPIGTQMSRTNYETNAERSILANYSNPNKTYNVEGLINNTVGSAPEVLRGTLRRQLNEWISPELRRGSATVQEILDDIGRNKPQIREQVSENIMPGTRDFIGESRTQRRGAEHLPNIPTPGPAYSGPEALQTLMPLRYTERNLSTHVPGAEPIHRRAGHGEIGAGDYKFDPSNLSSIKPNLENRLFHTRSGLYEIDGKKVFIPAEGQSGVYSMGTSRTKAGESLRGSSPVVQDISIGLRKDLFFKDIWREHEVPMAEMVDKIAPYLKPGYSKDDWLRLAAKQQDEIAAARQSGLRRYGITEDEYVEHYRTDHAPLSPGTGTEYSSVEERVQLAREHFDLVATDNVSKYEPLYNKMIGGGPAVDPPFFDEWFPLHMKTALNDAVEQGADTVRFPINDYAVARQTGQPLSPYRAREFREEFTPTPEQIDYFENPNWTGWEDQTQQLGRDMSEWQPNEQSQALATHYQKRTDDGLRRIEAEYGVELNPRRVRDDNNNVFLEIDLTPELKDAFTTVIFNRGGEVRAPLMPLKYRG